MAATILPINTRFPCNPRSVHPRSTFGLPTEGRRARPLDAAVFRRRRLVAAMGVGLLTWLAVRVILLLWAGIGAFTASADGVQVATIAPAAGLVSPASGSATMPGSVSGPSAVYVVQSGDTLWKIASTIRPDDDPRDVVAALRERTGGPLVHPGQRIDLTGF